MFLCLAKLKKKKKALWRFKKKVYKEIPQPCCTENQTVYRNQDNDWCWITAMIPSDLEVIYILDFGKNSHYVSTTLMCISVYTTHVWVTINPWFDLYTRHDCQTCCLSVSAFYLDSSVTWCERSVTLAMSDLQVEPALFLIVLILRTENETDRERGEKKKLQVHCNHLHFISHHSTLLIHKIISDLMNVTAYCTPSPPSRSWLGEIRSIA